MKLNFPFLTIKKTAPLVLFVLFSILHFHFLFKVWDTSTGYSLIPGYSRVEAWLESASCAQKTGIPLVICDEDKGIIPLETYSAHDDRGHPLAASLLAMTFNYQPNRISLTKFNLLFNSIALFMFALVGYFCGFRFLATALLFSCSSFITMGELTSPDVIPTYGGIVCTSLISLFLLHSLLHERWNHWTSKAIGILGILASLSIAIIMRNPLGIIGITGCLWLLFLNIRIAGNKSRNKIFMFFFLFVVVLIPRYFPGVVINFRNVIFNIPPSIYPSSHGIAPNLYLGLGAEANPWGIEWDDAKTSELVDSKNPEAGFITEEYFDILWAEYFRIVKESPLTVMGIYWKKTLRTAKLLKWPIEQFFLLILFVLLSSYHHIKRTKGLTEQPRLDFLAATGVIALLVFGQGVLGHPSLSFVYAASFPDWAFWLLLFQLIFTQEKIFNHIKKFSSKVLLRNDDK